MAYSTDGKRTSWKPLHLVCLSLPKNKQRESVLSFCWPDVYPTTDRRRKGWREPGVRLSQANSERSFVVGGWFIDGWFDTGEDWRSDNRINVCPVFRLSSSSSGAPSSERLVWSVTHDGMRWRRSRHPLRLFAISSHPWTRRNVINCVQVICQQLTALFPTWLIHPFCRVVSPNSQW